jgi:hypothetical protein
MRQAALGMLIVAIAAAIVGVDFAQRNVPNPLQRADQLKLTHG